MEKKDIIFLLLVIGSIITLILGFVLVNLAIMLTREFGVTVRESGPIVQMAVGVVVVTTIIFPILIIVFNILTLKALDENKIVGIVFGFITLILCIITILFSTFFIIVVGALPREGNVANIIMSIRGSLGLCIAAQILVLVGAILNLSYQFSK